MPEATSLLPEPPRFKATTNITAGDVVQLRDGRAAVIRRDVTAGTYVEAADQGVKDVWSIAKTSGIALLDGQPVYWDYSANQATYTRANDRDFYVGRAFAFNGADASTTDASVAVNFNVNPPHDIDLTGNGAEPEFGKTTIVGTQALGGLALNRRAAGSNIVISSTSEAQKVDILGEKGFSKSAKAIVEFWFRVVDDGSGTVVDVNIGVANGTHASNADSITEFIGIHLDANDVNIYASSRDGTSTPVAAVDTTLNYTAGTWHFVQIDMRNPASCAIYIDGVRVNSSSVFNVNSAAGPLYPLVHCEKSSAADTYEIDVIGPRVRLGEQP